MKPCKGPAKNLARLRHTSFSARHFIVCWLGCCLTISRWSAQRPGHSTCIDGPQFRSAKLDRMNIRQAVSVRFEDMTGAVPEKLQQKARAAQKWRKSLPRAHPARWATLLKTSCRKQGLTARSISYLRRDAEWASPCAGTGLVVCSETCPRGSGHADRPVLLRPGGRLQGDRNHAAGAAEEVALRPAASLYPTTGAVCSAACRA